MGIDTNHNYHARQRQQQQQQQQHLMLFEVVRFSCRSLSLLVWMRETAHLYLEMYASGILAKCFAIRREPEAIFCSQCLTVINIFTYDRYNSFESRLLLATSQHTDYYKLFVSQSFNQFNLIWSSLKKILVTPYSCICRLLNVNSSIR